MTAKLLTALNRLRLLNPLTVGEVLFRSENWFCYRSKSADRQDIFSSHRQSGVSAKRLPEISYGISRKKTNNAVSFVSVL